MGSGIALLLRTSPALFSLPPPKAGCRVRGKQVEGRDREGESCHQQSQPPEGETEAQSEEGTLDSHWHTRKVDAKDVTHRPHSPVPQEQGEERRGRLGSCGEEGGRERR